MTPELLAAAAIFAAVVATGLILVAGGWVVRRLRIPNDPPEACHFEPPPPQPVPAGDRAAAVQRAHERGARAALGAQAYAGLRTARAAQELAEWVADHDRTRAESARAAAAEAVTAAERAHDAFRTGDTRTTEAALVDISTAAGRVTALAQGLPDATAAERRKLLFLSLLLLATGMVAALVWWR